MGQDVSFVPKRYYNSINILRGITIFCIVWNHFTYNFYPLVALKRYPEVNLYNALIETGLRAGDSWYFVFISGFLFAGVFYKPSFSFYEFIKKKLLKVFLPYLIFLIPYAYLHSKIFPHPTIQNTSFLYVVDFYMTLGSFWYIPFIMCIFLCTPCFIEYLHLNNKLKIFILFIFILITTGWGRTPANPFLMTIYFAPAYLAGLLICFHYEKFINFSKNFKMALFIIFLFSLVFLYAINLNVRENFFLNDKWKIPFYSNISFFPILKIFSAIILIWISEFFCKIIILEKFFALLSTFSFTIYFFHPYILLYFHKHTYLSFFESIPHSYDWLISLSFAFITILLIILIFYPLKKLLGKYSRYFIAC